MPYISLEKLLDFPLRRNGEHCDMEHANPHFLNGIETAMEYAETLPPENVAPMVHGRWIYESVEFTYEKDIRCSICGTYVDRATKYCPDCGARMDLE